MALSPTAASELADALRARYDALLEQVRDEIAKTENQQYIALIDHSPADLADQATADALADISLAVIDRHVQELRHIEAARDRMRDGSYGRCVECGDDIGVERLRAYLTAQTLRRVPAPVREAAHAQRRDVVARGASLAARVAANPASPWSPSVERLPSCHLARSRRRNHGTGGATDR